MTHEKKTSAVADDTKERFREALERKNASHHPTADGDRNTGTVHGSETSGPVQPMFRRKSG